MQPSLSYLSPSLKKKIIGSSGSELRWFWEEDERIEGERLAAFPCLSQGNKSTIVRVSGALWQPCEALSEANSNNALKDRRARERQEGKKQQGPF